MTNKNGILRSVLLLTVISTLPGVQCLEAGNITYDINLYFPQQIPVTLTGTVTTDGTLGDPNNLISYTHILSENIKITDLSDHYFDFSYSFDISQTLYATTNDPHDDPRMYWPQFYVYATETSLFLMPHGIFSGGSFNYIPWEINYVVESPWNEYENTVGLQWQSNQWGRYIKLDGVTPFEFATVQNSSAVPEPTSLSLLSVGSLALVGAAWRRRRGKTLVTHS